MRNTDSALLEQAYYQVHKKIILKRVLQEANVDPRSIDRILEEGLGNYAAIMFTVLTTLLGDANATPNKEDMIKINKISQSIDGKDMYNLKTGQKLQQVTPANNFETPDQKNAREEDQWKKDTQGLPQNMVKDVERSAQSQNVR